MVRFTTLEIILKLLMPHQAEPVAPEREPATLQKELNRIRPAIPTERRDCLQYIRLDSSHYRGALDICRALSVEYEGYKRSYVGIHGLPCQERLARAFDDPNPSPQVLSDAQAAQAQRQIQWAMETLEFNLSQAWLNEDTFRYYRDYLMEEQWHMHCHRRGLSTDNQVARESTVDIITAYSYPIQRSQLMGRKPAKRPGQADFKKALIKRYNCTRNAGSETWCPVTQAWIPLGANKKTQCTAAHIVPYSFGDRNFARVFGSKGGLMHVSNGIMLHKDVEQAFDNNKLVIVPTVENSEVWGPLTKFKSFVLDEQLMNGGTYGDNNQYQWSNVHDRILVFRNDFTPHKRCLYFHILLTIMRKCIHQPAHWAFNLEALMQNHFLITESESETGPVIRDEAIGYSLIMKITSVIGNPDLVEKIKHVIPIEDVEGDPKDEAETAGAFLGFVKSHDHERSDPDPESAEETNDT
jgi:hypothetical protein